MFNFVHVPNDIQIALRQSVEDYGPEPLTLYKIMFRDFNYLVSNFRINYKILANNLQVRLL